MMDETLGKIHFWGTIISFNFIFIPLFVLGAAGQHRRIYNYKLPRARDPRPAGLRVFATVSLLVMLAFQFVFLFNFFWSMFAGKKAPEEPVESRTPSSGRRPSPPPTATGPPGSCLRVYRGPYEYSVPGREDDYWPQNEPT